MIVKKLHLSTKSSSKASLLHFGLLRFFVIKVVFHIGEINFKKVFFLVTGMKRTQIYFITLKYISRSNS